MDECRERNLPLEIVENIINVVDDKKTLKACALSCSYFRRNCQGRLFQDFEISCDNDNAVFQEGGLVHTVVYTDLHANVVSLIRWLKIENQYGIWGMQGEGKFVDYILGNFIRKLTVLERLDVRGDWVRIEARRACEWINHSLTTSVIPGTEASQLEIFPHAGYPLGSVIAKG